MRIADLHIHSKYSRATSGECVSEYLDLWARRKGIGLVGTGDFTHPAWRAELGEKLEREEDGLYRLRREFVLPGAQFVLPGAQFVLPGAQLILPGFQFGQQLQNHLFIFHSPTPLLCRMACRPCCSIIPRFAQGGKAAG